MSRVHVTCAEPSAAPASRAVRAPSASLAPLRIGSPGDAAEREADQAADRVMRGQRVQLAPTLDPARDERGERDERDEEEREAATEIRRKPRGAAPPDGRAPPAVAAALRAPGCSLDPASRSYFEPRFGISFADVRIHDDSAADRAARAIDARAFTLGRRIAFAAGAYAPASPAGRHLLAHELAHVAQHVAAGARPATIRRQTPPGAAAPAPPPRLDYVFIVGPTTDPFYAAAAHFYRSRHPHAVLVLSENSLTGILNYLASYVTAPAANIYIVSHGNEDGTLSFALAPGDVDSRGRPDTHIEVRELRARLHPAGGGASGLAAVGPAVDANTRIHIKGCDIGRTQEMVELLDEAFGGAGTVTAPSHEQVFGWDTARGRTPRARERAHLIADFTAAQPAIPPEPAPVDPSLRGQARTDAVAERARLVRDRQAAIRNRAAALQAEERRIQPQLDRVAADASVYERLSGPMFQRPGTTLFTAAELRPEVDRLYGHLPEPERASLARRLARRHAGAAAVVDLQGQRVFAVRPFSTGPVADPATVAQARVLFHANFAGSNFAPTAMRVTRGATRNTFDFDGRYTPPGRPAYTSTYQMQIPVTPNADLIASARALVNNPDRYAWRVEERRGAGGTVTRTAVGERVVAYLHHGSLNPGGLPDFNPPESNAAFYATSTFAPPPPPPPAPAPAPGAPPAPVPSPPPP